MVLGWERINAKRSEPNKNIVFIKPLPGADEATARDYLNRIAAQCLPIMNKHHLAVLSLEEYEPNLEFWGRNFNNGESIQLVLKSPSTGRWLPFKFVQMVMMHELAHNKQMNHSKAFWAVRNGFSAEMRDLWEKGYTGEGLWGRGVLLDNGLFIREELGEGELLPEHMCGGTFRSRGGKKRKAKPKVTYKEAKERRIRKKFGVNGVALGTDANVKAELEIGKRPAGKPRVAGSKRGRELRAAAALARFEVKKEEPHIKDEDLVTDSEAESEDEVIIKAEPDDALDINGLRLVDKDGGGMVKVCEDEDKDDDDAKRELLELQSFPGQSQRYISSKGLKSTPSSESKPLPPVAAASFDQVMTSALSRNPQTLNLETEAPCFGKTSDPMKHSEVLKLGNMSSKTAEKQEQLEHKLDVPSKIDQLTTSRPPALEGSCPVCSIEVEPSALTCSICAHVLNPGFVPDSWACKSDICKGSVYLNAGDVGVCGACGTGRSSANGI